MTPIEWLIIAALSFGGGYYVGHDNTTAECKQDALVISNCPDLSPPTDKTFGGVTATLVDTVSQYRKCKAACVPTKN